MKIQFNSATSAGAQYKFLSDISSVIEACTSIAQTLQQQLQGEISADDAMELIEVNALNRDFSTQLLPTFGNNILSTHCMQWVRMAMATFDERQTSLSTACEIYMPIANSEAKEIVRDLEYVAGCLSFALLSSLGVLKLSDAELQENPIMSEGVQAFIQDKFKGDKSHLRFLLALFRHYGKGHPFARVSDQFPDSWEQFCDMLEGFEFGQEVLNYGDALYICDVKAILLGKIDVDDTLVSILERRTMDTINARQLFPHKLSLFLEAIPNNYCDFMLLYEDRLSEELIDSILSGSVGFDERFVASVSKAPLLRDIYLSEHKSSLGVADHIVSLLGSDYTREFEV